MTNIKIYFTTLFRAGEPHTTTVLCFGWMCQKVFTFKSSNLNIYIIYIKKYVESMSSTVGDLETETQEDCTGGLTFNPNPEGFK